MSSVGTQLTQWFSERPKWLQEATRRHCLSGSLDAKDCEELLVLCKREAGIVVEGYEGLTHQPIHADAFGDRSRNINLRLNAIGAISGINALAPKCNLEFGDESLTIVYGANGAGKSGYTRILKHCCGGRGNATLHKNVFSATSTEQKCRIHYTYDGSSHELEWLPGDGIHQHLRNLCIYDTGAAHVYVNSENEVTYEPSVLGCFTTLVDVCEHIDGQLLKEVARYCSCKPVMPSEYSSTLASSWYNAVNAKLTDQQTAESCTWPKSGDEKITELSERLNEANPSEKARALRKTKNHIRDLKIAFAKFIDALSDSVFADLQSKREDAAQKRRTADVDAERVFENAPLEGVASESWKLMWEAARRYSETVAYARAPFPSVEEDKVCVLCQQTLGQEGRERLAAFESFVKSNLESNAKAAEMLLQATTKKIQDTALGIGIEVGLDLCKIAHAEHRTKILECAQALERRKQAFLASTKLQDLELLPSYAICDVLSSLEQDCEDEAIELDEVSKGDKRNEVNRELVELRARRWVCEQKAAIESEIVRLKHINFLDRARKLVNTKALSTKKSLLSEELVTNAFVARFDKELATLGAAKIHVFLEKTRSVKGHVWHRIRLKGNSTNVQTAEVLSEGEFRIVSLAAFLADVDTTGNATAFIFDDPISSLDQGFEEAVSQRLVEVSATRQVIVFTHRLSLLSMLEDAAEKFDVKARTISVQRESWGSGQPSEPPLPAQKPKTALNTLIGQRLSKAQKIWSDEGTEAYTPHAKALCTDIRITIERLIEWDLLADVVQRFRRPINTMGKIGNLARIQKSDCEFLDAMMTKYSRYEHSQPREAPVSLPEPLEIKSDLERLKTWQLEFSNRIVA